MNPLSLATLIALGAVSLAGCNPDRDRMDTTDEDATTTAPAVPPPAMPADPALPPGDVPPPNDPGVPPPGPQDTMPPDTTGEPPSPTEPGQEPPPPNG